MSLKIFLNILGQIKPHFSYFFWEVNVDILKNRGKKIVQLVSEQTLRYLVSLAKWLSFRLPAK